MSKITTYFNLRLTQRQVDFVDVCLNTDNELFIDPKLIEQNQNPAYGQMVQTLRVFSRSLFNCVRRNQRGKASELFRGIAEPNETRLGYSANNPKGNSLRGKLGEELLDSIFSLGTAITQTAGINSFGDLEIFIKGVGCDRISDTITKIVKADLIDFTQNQCQIHNIPMQIVPQKDIYNAATNKWEKDDCQLPVYQGKPIIFVPKSIIRRKKDGDSNLGFFFRFAFRSRIKTDPAFTRGIPKKGRDGQVTSKDFFRNLVEKGESLKDVAKRWVSKYPELLRNYRSALVNEGRLTTLSDDEISEIVDLKCK